MTNNSRIFKSLKLIVFYLLTIKIQTLNIQKVSQVYANVNTPQEKQKTDQNYSSNRNSFRNSSQIHVLNYRRMTAEGLASNNDSSSLKVAVLTGLFTSSKLPFAKLSFHYIRAGVVTEVSKIRKAQRMLSPNMLE